MTPTRTTPPRATPTKGISPTTSKANGLASATAKGLASAKRRDPAHPHSHSLSMLGAERYQNQLFTTSNAEMFNGKKKNPSMYRRPSELGLATTPMEDKSEIRRNYQPVNIGRQHIVKPIPDHAETYQAAVDEWKEDDAKDTESKSHYKDLQPKRPVCHKLNDHITVGIEGDFEKDSEVRATYKDLQARRPICQKLVDHDDQIQPKEPMDETSEYRSTINKLEGMQLKGERALPPWLGMEKVTPFGTAQDQTRE